jgi:DNA-binding MarR family transcriptional regulator
VKQRQALVDRLMAAQPVVRRRFQAVHPPGIQEEFAEVGGITVHQMEVVRRLLLGDEMTMHDVASTYCIGASGATQLIDRLERRGLVTRVRDERDRRIQRVVATDRAKAIARRFKSAMRGVLEEVTAALDDAELQTYVELTERIAAATQDDAERAEAPQRERRLSA